MSSEVIRSFNKEDLDKYLYEVGREYRKLGGKRMPAELILIGGASVLINYGFRDTTTDIDALINAASTMKEAIGIVAERNNLDDNWLNADFTKTGSYSSKIVQYSKYYKTFANVLTVRTVAGEYLLAMKLRSGRKYKFDLSDVIGILAYHEKINDPLTMEKIIRAATELYGSWDALPEFSRLFIEELMRKDDYEKMYSNIAQKEKANKYELENNGWNGSHVITEKNAEEILAELKK